GLMQFRGGVLITGYWGSLSIAIKDPQLKIEGDKAELAIRFDSYAGNTKFDVIAQGDFDASANSSALNLTYTGQMILGQQYQVGQPIDSATIQFA
ncbi:MAG: HtaA domain-containing protein, partial [Micrococcales bacterium]